MKDLTKTIKRTNKALAALAFEGSPLGTIADLIQHTKENFDLMIAKIKVTLIEFLLFSERDTLAVPEYAPISGCRNGEHNQVLYTLEARRLR